MDILSSLAHGLLVAISPTNLMLALVGSVIGTLVGALPGLGPVNGVAILIPIAFTMGLDPTSSMVLLGSVYYGAMYGGRISSIVLNIPGDEAAVMTLIDGYPMAKQGRAAGALVVSGTASFVGAMIATIGLTFFAPLLANVAIYFGPSEYVALYVLAFLTIGGVSGKNMVKTLIGGVIGLILSTVGIDHSSSIPRYTFGLFKLYDGFDFVVVVVGLFAVSEFFAFLEHAVTFTSERIKVGSYREAMRELRGTWWTMIRSSVLGFVAGVLPGSGSTLGSYLAYVAEKQISDKAGTFGKGDARGVAAPEAGNNAAAGGALVPMLTLGVPGSGTTAVMLGLLLALNITPWPLLFQQQPDLVWGLIASRFIANIALIVLNLPLVGIFTKILALPYWIIMPVVLMIGMMGVYAISNSAIDLYLMVGFGVLGYVLRKLNISLIPIILGILLGEDLELNLRRALSLSDGDWGFLIQSPISISIYVFAAATLAVGLFFSRRAGAK